jgi:hypothetical protein
MADQLQLRGGTTTEHSTFTGALREVTVDTTKKTLVVHDNATAGGTPLAKENLSNVPAGTITSTMIADGTIATADIADGAVTSGKIADGTIVNADINAAAAIDLTKLANGALPTGITVSSANITDLTLATADIADGAVTSAKIADGTLVNADINASAAIAGTKISPDFGSQNTTTTGTSTAASFIPTSSTAPSNGVYLPSANNVAISTNSAQRLLIDASGLVGVGVTPTEKFQVGATNNSSVAIKISNSGTFGFLQQNATSGTGAIELGSGGAFPLVLSTNQTERLRITSDGKLGLGSSAPASKLTVAGTQGNYRVDPDSVTNEIQLLTTVPDNSGFRNYRVRSNQIFLETSGSTALTIDTSQRVGIGDNAPSTNLVLSGAGSSIAGLNAHFLISDSTAAAAGVGGSMLFEGKYLSDGSRAVYAGISGTKVNSTNGNYQGQLKFYTRPDGQLPAVAMTIDSSQRVGIGTTSPAFGAGDGLEVARSGVSTIRVSSNTQGVELRSDAGTGTLETRGAFPLLFGIQGTERARIDSSGRFLVGTSTARTWTGVTGQFQLEGTSFNASSPFFINNSNDQYGPFLLLGKSRGTSIGSNTIVQSGDLIGSINFAGADGSVLRTGANIEAFIDGTPGSGDLPTRLVFSTTADGASSPTERLRVASSGAVELRNGGLYLFSSAITSGAGTNALRYSTSTGLVTYDTSTRLIKENIVDCEYGISALKQLQPRKYTRTDDNSTEIGFIADEVVDVIPEIVPFGPKAAITHNKEDADQIPISVNYDRLTVMLTKALQEAVERIETLEAEVAALKAQ